MMMRSVVFIHATTLGLTQATGLTLGFQESEDIVLPDWSNNVTDDAAGAVVQELHTDLGDSY